MIVLAPEIDVSTDVTTDADRAARQRRLAASPIAISRLALAALVLHVVFDSFVDLRPGTSPLGHLISGTVPIGVLVLIMALLPRLRTGALAMVDLLVGIAATIAATAAPGAALVRGDVGLAEISGAFVAVSGLGLIVVGIMATVRSRRRAGRRWMRRLTVGFATFLAVLFVAVPVGLGYVAANRSGPVHEIAWLGAPSERVVLRTADGLDLAAAYVPSRNGAAVIVFPGVTGRQVAGRADMFVRHGYGVLVVEPRGNGASEGDPNLFGWSGEPDIAAALDFLNERTDVDPGRIGGLGLSVGGELMLQAAAHDQRLAAVVAEGAGARSIREDRRTPLPEAFVQVPLSAALTAAVAVFSDSMPPPSLDRVVAEIAPRPLLLIWASPGQGGEWFNPDYFDAAGADAQIWEIRDSAHVNGLAERPEEYERRVIDFFDEALLATHLLDTAHPADDGNRP